MLFKQHTKEEQAGSLAHFLPGGKVFAKKWVGDSVIFKFLMGLACELFRVEEQMNLIAQEHDINITTDFIDEWESAVGIPDECLSNTGTLEERRANVLIKIAKMNVTTAQDFIDLAVELGLTVEITPGADAGLFPMTFPFILFDSAQEARFTMVVTFDRLDEVFPYTFPIVFGIEAVDVIRCLFDRIKPANVQILYKEGTITPIVESNLITSDGFNIVTSNNEQIIALS